METTPALKVVIVYETFAAAVRAKEMSGRLTAELNSSGDVSSLESLIHLPLRQLAATDFQNTKEIPQRGENERAEAPHQDSIGAGLSITRSRGPITDNQ